MDGWTVRGRPFSSLEAWTRPPGCAGFRLVWWNEMSGIETSIIFPVWLIVVYWNFVFVCFPTFLGRMWTFDHESWSITLLVPSEWSHKNGGSFDIQAEKMWIFQLKNVDVVNMISIIIFRIRKNRCWWHWIWIFIELIELLVKLQLFKSLIAESLFVTSIFESFYCFKINQFIWSMNK